MWILFNLLSLSVPVFLLILMLLINHSEQSFELSFVFVLFEYFDWMILSDSTNIYIICLVHTNLHTQCVALNSILLKLHVMI